MSQVKAVNAPQIRTSPSRQRTQPQSATPLPPIQGPPQHKETHKVLNQVPPCFGFDAFASNARLKESIAVYAPEADMSQLHRIGNLVASEAYFEHAQEANHRQPPVFTPYDRQGNRINAVRYSPAYHALMKAPLVEPAPTNPVSATALFLMFSELDGGTGCPLTMRPAGQLVLDKAAERTPAFREWSEKLHVNDYDPVDAHISQKKAVMVGMSMTEKQGGSDVRANTTQAVPLNPASANQEGAAYAITGHKWFTSAPMCDGFLTLAKISHSDTLEKPAAASRDDALSCFLIPRWVAPGERNAGLRFQRIKHKLGDQSNASSEVEYDNAVGYLVGEKGAGVRTIIDMVAHTRLSCMAGSSAIISSCLHQAIHHCQYRSAFGRPLLKQPLMRSVLCDLAIEAEAGIALTMRVANFFRAPSSASTADSVDDAYMRIACAVGKFYICKRTPGAIAECLECLGGNGYTEDFPLARHYRQAPLNAIWEGSGNVIVLDVFRAIAKTPQTIRQALKREAALSKSNVVEDYLTETLTALDAAFAGGESGDAVLAQGRHLVLRLGRVLQAAALATCGPRSVFDAYVGTRLLNGDRNGMYGTIAEQYVSDELIQRHAPVWTSNPSAKL